MQTKAIKGKREQIARRASWYQIVEKFNASGQSQINYCKQNNINKDHFSYYVNRWRRDKHCGSAEPSFIPLDVTKAPSQSKWVLNVASGISLELPEGILMQQLSELLTSLRKNICS